MFIILNLTQHTEDDLSSVPGDYLFRVPSDSLKRQIYERMRFDISPIPRDKIFSANKVTDIIKKSVYKAVLLDGPSFMIRPLEESLLLEGIEVYYPFTVLKDPKDLSKGYTITDLVSAIEYKR